MLALWPSSEHCYSSPLGIWRKSKQLSLKRQSGKLSSGMQDIFFLISNEKDFCIQICNKPLLWQIFWLVPVVMINHGRFCFCVWFTGFLWRSTKEYWHSFIIILILIYDCACWRCRNFQYLKCGQCSDMVRAVCTFMNIKVRWKRKICNVCFLPF